MNCPSCGRENPSEARFCMICATRFGTPEPASSSDSTCQSTELLSPTRLTSTDFVGRQREMAELMAALEDALAGNRPVLE
ncbi:MAG: zinc ribbon domain-containing protein [Chloroflexi bacterium]|nr:zinc ribbon domain-containing protein [Chloroflexota bacterium]